MYPSQAPRTRNGTTQYPGLTPGYTGSIQTSDNYYIGHEQAPRRRNNLLEYPQATSHYDVQRTVYPPRTHNGLLQQGGAYTTHTDPMIQSYTPLLRGTQLAQPATNGFYGEYARAVPLTSGVSAYMAQQAPADPVIVRASPPWIQIANGRGVDLRQSLPEMAEIIENRDIVIRCPDGTSKIVKADGHAINLRMASKVVQRWYERHGGRSSYMLLGFRVDNGVYIAHIA